MYRISKDEQIVLNEKAEEIKKIICSEKFSWNHDYPKIVKTIVVTFLELRLDSIVKRLDIPELKPDYIDTYYNIIRTAGLSFFRLNREERKMIFYSIYASFFNDNKFITRPDYQSLDQKYKDLRKKLNDEIVDLNMNLNYKTMLGDIDFPMSLQRKYARLGLFIYKNMMNNKFKSVVKKELLIMQERLPNFELKRIALRELDLVLNLFPKGMFPNNSIWSIFYIFKFKDSKEEIDNLIEFKRSRKMKNLIAIRPIFEIKTKNESYSEIISLKDFLQKESAKIEDYQIKISEEYKNSNKLKYKKREEIDYKDFMNRWYSQWVTRGTTEQLLKLALTSMKRNEIHYNSQDRSTADKPKKSIKKYKDPLPKYKDEPLQRWSDLNLIIDCEKENSLLQKNISKNDHLEENSIIDMGSNLKVVFKKEEKHLKHLKGIHYIAKCIDHPGKIFLYKDLDIEYVEDTLPISDELSELKRCKKELEYEIDRNRKKIEYCDQKEDPTYYVYEEEKIIKENQKIEKELKKIKNQITSIRLSGKNRTSSDKKLADRFNKSVRKAMSHCKKMFPAFHEHINANIQRKDFKISYTGKISWTINLGSSNKI